MMEQLSTPLEECYDGVEIRRVWRPAFSQSSNLGRIANTIFVLLAWTWRALVTKRSENECVIIGTDPPLSVLAAIPWRLLRRKTKIVHWCHDLYPDAAVAEGIFKKDSLAVRMIQRVTNLAYRNCDYLVDLGDCMRNRLPRFENKTGSTAANCNQTITPWSLVEPKDIPEPSTQARIELFGQNQVLGFLYSGNLGRAHGFTAYVELAKALSGSDSMFCFAGRGPRFEELKIKSESIANIRFAGFSSEDQLQDRLSAADIHLVSLQSNWTGCVVPSKFFGALAVGRPVLFYGSSESSIAKWIRQYNVGWVLQDEQDVEQVATELRVLARDADKLRSLKERCFRIYTEQFSKNVQLNRWHNLLLGNS